LRIEQVGVGLSERHYTAPSSISPRCPKQPQRAETFKLSTDPLFIEKVRYIVGLYLNPPDRALVLCVDEKNQIQALDRTQPILPMMPRNPRFHVHFIYYSLNATPAVTLRSNAQLIHAPDGVSDRANVLVLGLHMSIKF
jgi:hypothetical protein